MALCKGCELGIHRLIVQSDDGPQDVSQRHGPEFNDPARGEYLLEVFPITAAALEPITLLPTELKSYLLENLAYLETSL